MDHWAPTVRHGPDGTGQMTDDINTIVAVTGRYRVGSTSVDCAAHATGADTWLDVYGELFATAAQAVSTSCGFLVRYVDTSNYYQISSDIVTGSLLIKKVVAGATTNLVNNSTAWPSAGTNRPLTFRAEIQGDVLRAFRNGVLGGSARDTAFQAAGPVAVYMRSTVAANLELARFEAGPLTTTYTPAIEVQQAGPLVRASRLR